MQICLRHKHMSVNAQNKVMHVTRQTAVLEPELNVNVVGENNGIFNC